MDPAQVRSAMSASITIFGAGSWGTALAVHLSRRGREVTLWARREEAIQHMRRTRKNPTYLPEIEIPPSVQLTSDPEEAATASSLWAVAVPSQGLRSVVSRLDPFVHPDLLVVSLAKGIENETLQTMTGVIADELTTLRRRQIGVLHGPSHAEEVAEARPTTVVASGHVEAQARRIQESFMTNRLRVYVNTDVVGVEIGGASKNVLAIAAGISDGVGYGDNAKAALITRGIAETRRLGVTLGAKPETFAGLTGIGDLVVTCMSAHSRNRHLGEQMGAGKTLEEVLEDMNMVAEGVRTTRSIHDLAERHEVEMPITEAVYTILFEGAQPREVVDRLMTRSAKREQWVSSDPGS